MKDDIKRFFTFKNKKKFAIVFVFLGLMYMGLIALVIAHETTHQMVYSAFGIKSEVGYGDFYFSGWTQPEADQWTERFRFMGIEDSSVQYSALLQMNALQSIVELVSYQFMEMYFVVCGSVLFIIVLLVFRKPTLIVLDRQIYEKSIKENEFSFEDYEVRKTYDDVSE